MNKNFALSSRPKTLDNFICTKAHKIIFSNIIESKDFSSFIFFGSPGTGKSTIAYILASSLTDKYSYFNAATDKKEDLVSKIKNSKIIIIDEIHRLNKDKQDILLPYLENKEITVYATTTENPYFKINPALRSRMLIVELKKPSHDEILEALKNTLSSSAAELEKYITNDILEHIAMQSGLDYRCALNNLELVCTLFSRNKNLKLDDIKSFLPSIQFAADKNGEEHYNYLSAFHKSLRGSDPDASLYYGFLIVKSGDFDGLFRRMLCATYEDVGLANVHLSAAINSAISAFERLGMPEGYLPIAYAILQIALSPKSNSAYLAALQVQRDLENGLIYDTPALLKDSHYKSAKKLGRGNEYKYPHDYPNHYIKQKYLPNELNDNNRYYNYQLQGYEAKINEYWKIIKGEK